jgi:hypothetical protein
MPYCIEFDTPPLPQEVMDQLFDAITGAFATAGGGMSGYDGDAWHAAVRLDPKVDTPEERARLQRWLSTRAEVTATRIVHLQD